MLLEPYNKEWILYFNQLKSVLLKQVNVEGLDLEHIGSTAVPGLAAKAIVDMDMVYQKPADFEQIKKDLEQLGYYHNGEQGIAGREVFKRRSGRSAHPVLDGISHHLYVCYEKNEELKRHLAFRDALRTYEEERLAYTRLKYKMAKEANQDKKTYAKLKEEKANEFIEMLIRKGLDF